ncbi:MAG: CPBP family intramembrane glutamic endopeptidase [Candidatus Odinarchaeota archaeon]
MSNSNKNPARTRDIVHYELSPRITTLVILCLLGVNLLVTVALPAKMSPERMTFYSNATLIEIIIYNLVAATVEEFVYRFFLIALVAELARTFTHGDKSLKWFEAAIKGQLVPALRISRVQTILIVSSSLIFAFTHVQDYGTWKVIPVFLIGMALGLVFCWHGLVIAVVLHSSYNIAIITGSLITLTWPAGWSDLLVVNQAMITSLGVLLSANLLKNGTRWRSSKTKSLKSDHVQNYPKKFNYNEFEQVEGP